MHDRGERRYLTEKYVQRQVSLDRMYKGGYNDKNRRPGNAIIDALMGYDMDDLNHPSYGNRYSPPPAKALGRWRNLSFDDCGTPHCPMCGNPRRITTRSAMERLTLQERKANDAYEAQVQEYLEPISDE